MPLKLPRLLKRSSPQIIEDKITHTVEIPVKLPVRLPVKPPVELPVELWYHIASMLKGKPDLSRLYRTNHTLRAICQQYLYCSITIYIGEYSKPICSLLRAMRNRRLADLVTSLCVSIAGVDHPHRQELCNRVDDLAGRLVVPLRNLWNLTYYCNMCCEHSDNHHLYMQRLETKVLTKLELSGQCFYKHQCPTLQILSSPCIRGITSLDLDYATRWNLEPAEQALIEGDSFLPCLRELSSPTFRLFTSRLRKGSITNIYSRSNHSDLFTLLSNSLPGVMYLYQQHIEALIPSVMDNPSPYLKLKTMSSFVFRNISDPREIVTALRGLSCLPHLSCIEISTSYSRAWSLDNSLQDNTGGDLALVQDIHQGLRRLSKVYTVRCKYRNDGTDEQYQFEIWELISDVWRSENVDWDTYQSSVRNERRVMLGIY